MYYAGPWVMSPRTWHEAGLFTCEDSSFNTKLSRKVLTSTFDKWKDEMQRRHCIKLTAGLYNTHILHSPYSPKEQVEKFSGPHFTALRAEAIRITQVW